MSQKKPPARTCTFDNYEGDVFCADPSMFVLVVLQWLNGHYLDFYHLQRYEVEPRYNKGPREFLFIYFTIAGAKDIVRYTKDFVI